MLRTNSRQARQNVRAWIADSFDGDNYGMSRPATFEGIAAAVLGIFRSEKPADNRRGMTEEARFMEWGAGLASVLGFNYFCDASAVETLGAILEESEAEKARFSESAAADLMTRLVYAELCRA